METEALGEFAGLQPGSRFCERLFQRNEEREWENTVTLYQLNIFKMFMLKMLMILKLMCLETSYI